MPSPEVTIVNWNIYLGADIVRLVDGAYPGPIEARAAELWRIVTRTNFAVRAGFIAQRLTELAPEVVTLQEVFRWTVASPATAEPVVVDYLDVLVRQLRGTIARYRAFRSSGFTCTVPLGDGATLTMQDSIVTLVRADLEASGFVGRPYAKARSVPIGGALVPAWRCWSAVDVHVPAGPLRVVNTHLEFDPPTQLVQAKELLSILDHPGPSLLAGDFNLDAGLDAGRPRNTPFDLVEELRRRGWQDAWRARGDGDGWTATQPEHLVNLESTLDTRIDWVLARGTEPFSRAWLLGASPQDRTALGLWPSDHAGVAASLSTRA